MIEQRPLTLVHVDAELQAGATSESLEAELCLELQRLAARHQGRLNPYVNAATALIISRTRRRRPHGHGPATRRHRALTCVMPPSPAAPACWPSSGPRAGTGARRWASRAGARGQGGCQRRRRRIVDVADPELRSAIRRTAAGALKPSLRDRPLGTGQRPCGEPPPRPRRGALTGEAASARKRSSSAVLARPSTALRCGKRPKRATMSRCCQGEAPGLAVRVAQSTQPAGRPGLRGA